MAPIIEASSSESERPPDLTDSVHKVMLPDQTPEVYSFNPRLIREINQEMRFYWYPGFPYLGAALLEPDTQTLLLDSKILVGKCLNGGVIGSQDLDWIGMGQVGPKPSRFIPKKKLFGYDKTPQSPFSSEWALLEYGMMLKTFNRDFIWLKYDDVHRVLVFNYGGDDTHIQMELNSNSFTTLESISGQANRTAIAQLLEIIRLAGIPTEAA